MKLSEFSRLTGFKRTTLQLYDRKGILKPVSRSEAGYWEYDMNSAGRAFMIAILKEAGYSLENALGIAEGDMNLIYNPKEEICRKVMELRQKLQIGTPVWKAFQEYAVCVEIEEAEEFAEVLRIQQRTGGDLIRTIRKAAERLQQSLALQQEIETTLSEKQLEQRIMTLMPSIMLLYMRLMNGAYLAPLYAGLGGAVIMTVALAANIGADVLADRLLRKALGGG